MRNNLPGIILEASPHNFHISKNDMNDPAQDIRSPEDYVNNAINAWMLAITSPLERSENPEAWDRYPAHFGKRIVMDNDWFPSSLPIGYVLVCFFRSVWPQTARLKTVHRIFTRWISNHQVRKAVFASYRSGEMFTDIVEIQVEETPDGLELGQALYGGSQPDMFEDPPTGDS